MKQIPKQKTHTLEEYLSSHLRRIQKQQSRMRIKDDNLFVPMTFKDEWPEERDVVTEKDIEEHCQRIKETQESLKERSGHEFGAFSANKKQEGSEVGLKGNRKRTSFIRDDTEKLQKTALVTPPRVFTLSNLEQEEQDTMQIRLKFEKAKLFERINLLVISFDNALENLRHKRFQLEINIIKADLKMMFLYQELQLLRNLQPKEEALLARQNVKLTEADDLSSNIADYDRILDQKRQEVNTLNEKKKQLMEEFEALLGNNPLKEALLKIYMRKIKVPKTTENSEATELEDDFETEDSEASDDELDDDEDVEHCPSGCPQELFLKVCQLRERRVIEDNLLSECNKQLDGMVRERESKLKKKRTIEGALTSIEKEIEGFQKEKQNALNQINVVVALRMHQVEYLVDGKLPEDLSRALVFSNTAIKQLEVTIKEHILERSRLRNLQKDFKKQYAALVRERRSRDDKVTDLYQRVLDVQMLKFGQVIDLDLLDSMNSKTDSEDLKVQLKKQEAQHADELVILNQQIDSTLDKLARVMKDDAACLNALASFKEKLQLLDQNMQAKASCPYRDPLVERKRAETEYKQLCKVVSSKDQEIRNLEEKIRAVQKEKRKVLP